MLLPKAFRVVAWLLGSLAVLALIAWLAIFVLGNTTFSFDAESRSAATETALGDIDCRKTFSAEFPFVRLECHSPSVPQPTAPE